MKNQTIQVVFSDGGIGDCIARMTPLLYVLKNQPHVHIKLYCPDYFKPFALRCFPPTDKITVISFTEVANDASLYSKTEATYSYDKFRERFNNLACHMVDHSFLFMNFMPLNVEDKNYPIINLDGVVVNETLPEKYAVVATGFTSPVREWLPEYVNEVTSHLVARGITPVFLGKKESHNGVNHVIRPVFKDTIDFSKGINLIDKLDLVQSAKVISESQLLVGLDNGLTHVAGCTDTPIVVGYTSVAKEHRLPYRKGIMGYKCYAVENTKKELSCTGCQSHMTFEFGHRFTNCFTKTLDCLKLLSGNKYIQAIEECLNANENYRK